MLQRITPSELAVACIKKYEGWHTERHYPYIGYGHKIQKGERFPKVLTGKEADLLLRSDLRKLCRVFRKYGKDSLLLAVLAYNVGIGRVLGNKTRRKSRLVRLLECGKRELIFREYVAFRRYNGKIVRSIERRRKMEFLLLYER